MYQSNKYLGLLQDTLRSKCYWLNNECSRVIDACQHGSLSHSVWSNGFVETSQTNHHAPLDFIDVQHVWHVHDTYVQLAWQGNTTSLYVGKLVLEAVFMFCPSSIPFSLFDWGSFILTPGFPSASRTLAPSKILLAPNSFRAIWYMHVI